MNGLKLIQEYINGTPVLPIIEYIGIMYGVSGLIKDDVKPLVYGGIAYLLAKVIDKGVNHLNLNDQFERRLSDSFNAKSIEQKIN